MFGKPKTRVNWCVRALAFSGGVVLATQPGFAHTSADRCEPLTAPWCCFDVSDECRHDCTVFRCDDPIDEDEEPGAKFVLAELSQRDQQSQAQSADEAAVSTFGEVEHGAQSGQDAATAIRDTAAEVIIDLLLDN